MAFIDKILLEAVQDDFHSKQFYNAVLNKFKNEADEEQIRYYYHTFYSLATDRRTSPFIKKEILQYSFNELKTLVDNLLKQRKGKRNYTLSPEEKKTKGLLTAKEKSEIASWAHVPTYNSINKDRTNDLSAIFDKLPNFSGTIYRGIFIINSLFERKFKIGSTISFNKNQSASKRLDVAEWFANRNVWKNGKKVIMVIKANKGKDISRIVPYDYYKYEEVILLPGSKFKVDKIKQQKEFFYVYLKEVS